MVQVVQILWLGYGNLPEVVFFERFLEPINVWVLIYCFSVFDASVLFNEDKEGERINNNANTSTSSTILEYSIALAYCIVLMFVFVSHVWTSL